MQLASHIHEDHTVLMVTVRGSNCVIYTKITQCNYLLTISLGSLRIVMTLNRRRSQMGLDEPNNRSAQVIFLVIELRLYVMALTDLGFDERHKRSNHVIIMGFVEPPIHIPLHHGQS